MAAPGPSRVFVLRHGRTTWNAQNRYQGQADPPLDEVGIAQAGAAAALLATFAPDLIITSDLQRASATAAALEAATGLVAVRDPRLRERSLGHWEGLTRDEVEVRFPEEFAQWRAGRNVARRGGETRDEVTVRTRELFAALPSVPIVVLVTHSATALALTEAVLELGSRAGSCRTCPRARAKAPIPLTPWRWSPPRANCADRLRDTGQRPSSSCSIPARR